MKDILPGLKTKITGWVMALIPVAGMLGYQISPEATGQWIEDSAEWIAGGYVLFGAAVHWFRNLANQ